MEFPLSGPDFQVIQTNLNPCSAYDKWEHCMNTGKYESLK